MATSGSQQSHHTAAGNGPQVAVGLGSVPSPLSGQPSQGLSFPALVKREREGSCSRCLEGLEGNRRWGRQLETLNLDLPCLAMGVVLPSEGAWSLHFPICQRHSGYAIKRKHTRFSTLRPLFLWLNSGVLMQTTRKLHETSQNRHPIPTPQLNQLLGGW